MKKIVFCIDNDGSAGGAESRWYGPDFIIAVVEVIATAIAIPEVGRLWDGAKKTISSLSCRDENYSILAFGEDISELLESIEEEGVRIEEVEYLDLLIKRGIDPGYSGVAKFLRGFFQGEIPGMPKNIKICWRCGQQVQTLLYCPVGQYRSCSSTPPPPGEEENNRGIKLAG